MQDISLLEQLHARGLIPVEEYNIRRVQIIDRITNTVYASNGLPIGMAMSAAGSAEQLTQQRQLGTCGVIPKGAGAVDSAPPPFPPIPAKNHALSPVQDGNSFRVAVLDQEKGAGESASASRSSSSSSSTSPRRSGSMPIMMPPPMMMNFSASSLSSGSSSPPSTHLQLPPIDSLTTHKGLSKLDNKNNTSPKIAPFVGPIPIATPPFSSLPPLPANMMQPPAFRPIPAFPPAPPPLFRLPPGPGAGDMLWPLPGSSSDLRYSVSSGHSSEDESSDGEHRRVAAAALKPSAVANMNVQDLLLPPAAKRQKIAESIGPAVDATNPLASLAALATSAEGSTMLRPQTYAESQKTILLLKEELRESQTATHDAHVALHNYMRRDEEVHRISNLSPFPGAFSPQTALIQQQNVWAAGPIHMTAPPAAATGLSSPVALFPTPVAPQKLVAPSHAQPLPSPPVPPAKPQRAGPQQKTNIFGLEITIQPPPKVVYQRILKPFPQLQVNLMDGASSADLPASMWNNLYVEASLLRADTREQVSHVDGTTMVRVWNGVATFRKLKIMSTTQQIGSVIVIRFALKLYEGNEFFPVPCAPVISTEIEVFSHSQYLKGSNARETDRALKAALELGSAMNPSIVSTAQSTAIKNGSRRASSPNRSKSDEGGLSSASSSTSGTRNVTPTTVSPPNEHDVELLVAQSNDTFVMRTGCDTAETAQLAKTNASGPEAPEVEVEVAAASS